MSDHHLWYQGHRSLHISIGGSIFERRLMIWITLAYSAYESSKRNQACFVRSVFRAASLIKNSSICKSSKSFNVNNGEYGVEFIAREAFDRLMNHGK